MIFRGKFIEGYYIFVYSSREVDIVVYTNYLLEYHITIQIGKDYDIYHNFCKFRKEFEQFYFKDGLTTREIVDIFKL